MLAKLRSNKFWNSIFIGALIIFAAAAIFLRNRPVSRAIIVQDGVLIESLNLSSVNKPYTLTVECEAGKNVIAVENGRICVIEADCPDGLCVGQGWLSSGTTPIVCLPHRLVIELVRYDTQDIDAVAR